MKRTGKSQWEFGELFPPETELKPAAAPARDPEPQPPPHVHTVSELTALVKRTLERECRSVWVAGEVTNCRRQSSGHTYFTLKDAGAQLACVLFRGTTSVRSDWIEDGRNLVVRGELTVYEPRGQYQLVVRQVEVQGVGALQLAFEQLKRRLQAEGLFDSARKRPLPRYPWRMGLVTSPTGAALRDVLHVIQRRHPALEILLAGCRVQGEGAAHEIANAIRLLNEWSRGLDSTRHLDLILVTRGGGSLEDLWAFNEEAVARAIFESQVPVVSAVGHEIDFTISDFVADLRGATPSAAAELITEGVFSCRNDLREIQARLAWLARERLSQVAATFEEVLRRRDRVRPERRLNEWLQHLDDLQLSLRRIPRQTWRNQSALWQGLRQRWLRMQPARYLETRRAELESLNLELAGLVRRQFETSRQLLARRQAELRLLSPVAVLQRGYSITQDAQTGTVIRESAEVRSGQRLRTRLGRGSIDSVAE